MQSPVPVDGVEEGHHLEEVGAHVDPATSRGLGGSGLVDVADVDQVECEGRGLKHVAGGCELWELVHALAGAAIAGYAVGLVGDVVRDVQLEEVGVIV